MFQWLLALASAQLLGRKRILWRWMGFLVHSISMAQRMITLVGQLIGSDWGWDSFWLMVWIEECLVDIHFAPFLASLFQLSMVMSLHQMAGFRKFILLVIWILSLAFPRKCWMLLLELPQLDVLRMGCFLECSSIRHHKQIVLASLGSDRIGQLVQWTLVGCNPGLGRLAFFYQQVVRFLYSFLKQFESLFGWRNFELHIFFLCSLILTLSVPWIVSGWMDFDFEIFLESRSFHQLDQFND